MIFASLLKQQKAQLPDYQFVFASLEKRHIVLLKLILLH